MIEFKDIEGYFIEIGARVSIPEGEHKGKAGTIKGAWYTGRLKVILDDGEEVHIESHRVRQARCEQ